MRRRIYKKNQEFGRLTIIQPYIKKQGKRWLHLVRCECGKEKFVCGQDMKRGHISSCGCLWQESVRTHNMSNEPEYKVWASMVQRCVNKNNKSYKNYGERGITVCDEWLFFDKFILDVGIRPQKDYTIERKNNSKGYNKNNCEWATRFEQSTNQRIRSGNKTGCKGVFYSEVEKKYIVSMQRNKERVHLGRFNDLACAIKARRDAENVFNKKEKSL